MNIKKIKIKLVVILLIGGVLTFIAGYFTGQNLKKIVNTSSEEITNKTTTLNSPQVIEFNLSEESTLLRSTIQLTLPANILIEETVSKSIMDFSSKIKLKSNESEMIISLSSEKELPFKVNRLDVTLLTEIGNIHRLARTEDFSHPYFYTNTIGLTENECNLELFFDKVEFPCAIDKIRLEDSSNRSLSIYTNSINEESNKIFDEIVKSISIK